jgi:hypothetical protein
MDGIFINGFWMSPQEDKPHHAMWNHEPLQPEMTGWAKGKVCLRNLVARQQVIGHEIHATIERSSSAREEREKER